MPRAVAVGVPHHVTQRGNGRRPTFLSDSDRMVYMELLQRYRKQFDLHLWAYCLMPNHVHLLAIPGREDSLARALGRTHAEYARYFNARHNSVGHLWQARFYSCPLERDQVWKVARYIEVNPVRAGMVEEAQAWRWSSAQAHVGGRDASGLIEMPPWHAEYGPVRWRDVLKTSVHDEAWQLRLSSATLTGRPFGSKAFLDELERQLGCRLRPRAAGRPRKSPGLESGQLALEIGK
jgi:putative transposase